MEIKKMFVYKLTLEDGQEFEYTFEGGITFNHKDEFGEDKKSIITSAVFVRSCDEEKPVVVVESDPVEAELVA